MAAPNKKKRVEGGSKFFIRHQWGSPLPGNRDGELSTPKGVAIGMDGSIYVVDEENNRIQCFHCHGAFIRKWGGRGSGDGEFQYPTALAIGACNGMRATILTAMSAIPALAAFTPGVLPICVAYVGKECIYVSDTFNDRMQVFDNDGRFIRKWGSWGSGDGQFHSPRGCVVGLDGLIYVCDRGNYRIQVFSCDGVFMRLLKPVGRDELLHPLGIAVSSDGLLYITDTANDCVICVLADGTISRAWGRRGKCNGEFDHPLDVVVNDEGTVFVADSGNHRIQSFRSDGTFICCSWSLQEDEGGKWSALQAMAIGMNGLMYVAIDNAIVVLDKK